MDDPLWPHFRPFWQKLGAGSTHPVLIAGGYGLFLKQRWLSEVNAVPTVVPITSWLNATPRVTKDVDLVLGLDLISDEAAVKQVFAALEQSDFQVSDRPPEQRWKFLKRLANDQVIVVEFHSPSPLQGHPGIKATPRRVKHKPSLGADGVHGRTNPEAIGSEASPHVFYLDGVTLAVPNPVTWSVMKLTATKDRWEQSQDASKQEEPRNFARLQAAKHAQDVCRIIAMMTMDERNATAEIVGRMKDATEFQIASEAYRSFFAESAIPAVQQAQTHWQNDDFATINDVLTSWFG